MSLRTLRGTFYASCRLFLRECVSVCLSDTRVSETEEGSREARKRDRRR